MAEAASGRDRLDPDRQLTSEAPSGSLGSWAPLRLELQQILSVPGTTQSATSETSKATIAFCSGRLDLPEQAFVNMLFLKSNAERSILRDCVRGEKREGRKRMRQRERKRSDPQLTHICRDLGPLQGDGSQPEPDCPVQ